MSVRRIVALAASISVIVLAPERWAFGQQNDQSTASSSAGLEEIIVTARRREERLQTVPLAITAFSSEAIKQHNVQDMEGLQHFVPSLTVNTSQGRDNVSLYLRGQGPTTSADPAVVTYFADVPIPAPPLTPSSGAQPGMFFDLDNVQVLKGPQGTLFGKNTTGGAVLISPHRPTNAFGGYGQITLGDYNLHDEEIALNVPVVSDKVLVRVSGHVRQRDGFTTNLVSGKDLDNEDYYAWRGSLILRPTDDFENYTVVSGLYSHNNGSGIQLVALNSLHAVAAVPGIGPVTLGPLPNAASFVQAGPGLPFLELTAAGKLVGLTFYPNLNAIFAQMQSLDPRHTMIGPANPISVIENLQVINTSRWDISDDVALKNIVSYTIERNDIAENYAGLPVALFINGRGGDAVRYSQYTEELQLSGRAVEDKLNWVVGGYLSFLHPVGHQSQSSCMLCTADVAVSSWSVSNLGETQRSQGLYGQATYDLSGFSDALDGLKLTGGYRYTWDYRSDFVNRPAVNVHTAGSGSFQSPSWTIGIDDQLDPNTLLYLSWRRGYKSGGFNIFTGNPAQFKYLPEIVKVVEVGLKSDWDIAGIKARTNLAAYHNDFTNMQRAFLDPSNPTAAVVINAGTAQQDGIEVEGTMVPVENVEVTGSYAYSHSKFGQLKDPLGNSIAGQTFPNMPLNKLELNARYHLPIDKELGDLSIGMDWSYQSHVTYTQAAGGDPLGIIGSYSLYNLRIDWNRIAGQPVDGAFYITNLTDTVYRAGGLDVYSALGFTSALYNPPRMFGVQLRYRFGAEAE